MKVIAPFEIGGRLYHVEAEGETMADVVRQIAPWQALEVFTKGKEEVVFSHRRTRKKHEYFALRCSTGNLEFALGQLLDPKGELFPGRIVDGKTVRAWEPIQYGNLEDEESGQPEPEQPRQTAQQSNLRAVPSDPAQNGQQAQGKPQSSNGAPEPSMEEKRALAFVAMQMVAITNRVNNKPNQWEVGNDGPGNGPHSVWLDEQVRPQCSCPELLKLRNGNPGYRCAHILAVKIYSDQLKELAKKAS